MSLSTLNYPPLIAVLGAGTLALIPIAEKAVADGTIPWNAIKGANAVAYFFSVWSTSRPGRYDSEEQFTDGKSPSSTALEGIDGMQKMSAGNRGRTLVPPAGWAFAIWGPIFLGELIFVGNQLMLQESSPLAPMVKKMTAPFVAAHAFQNLWAASFRPKYKGIYKSISVASLAGIAYSLSLAHAVFAGKSSSSKSLTTSEYVIYCLPISLHFGWTTAAALVNLNGMYALGDSVSASSVALLGQLSLIGATATGLWITTDRSAPVYGGVIAWALAAVASGLAIRLEETSLEDPKRVGIFGAKIQRFLSVLGALVTAGVSFATTKEGDKVLKQVADSEVLKRVLENDVLKKVLESEQWGIILSKVTDQWALLLSKINTLAK
jgi:hypothetical protein